TFYYTKRADLSYTVYYKEQGTENDLADAKVVDGQTYGNTVTENAIDIDGYNKVDPTSAEITITTGKNEYTFYYTKRADLSYTVYYKEQGTENELADAKVVDGKTFGDVVTENAIDIDGYNKVDPTSAEITITTGKNEYTFYYTKRADLSYTVYYKEQGTENELADAKVVDGKTFGDVVTENAIDIDGYNKVDPTSAEITITTGKNEYTFYYTKRADLSYTVYYKEQGTENELADAKVVDGKTFGDVVTENAIDIDGYNKVDPTSAEITITTGKNEYTFYYTKRADLSYTVYYKEQGTETKLAEAKVVNNKTFEEVITASIKAEDNATEKPKTIDGYECVEVKPGELSIGTGENVITFYYVKLCQYKIEYYLNGNLAEQYTVGPEKIRVGTTIGFETKTEELEKIDSAISGYKYIKYVGVDGKDNEGTTAYKDMNVIKVYYGLPVTSIEKTATEFVNAGDEIEYTIEVSNTGDWKTTITVTDTLEETEYVNGSSNITPSIDGKTLSWSIELEARGSKTISFRAKTNNESYGDEISNTAKIKGTNKEDTAVTRVNEIDVTYSEWLEGQKGTDLNIVFVLDNSSSMNFPIAGKTYVKDELNRKGSHVTPIAPSDKDKTRIENAKSAINSFIDSQANNKNTTMEVVTFNKSEKGTAKNMMTLMDIPDKDIQYRENLWGGYYYIEINGIECRVEKDVIGTDGKKHCGVYIPIDYGARLVGDNSVSNDILKKNVSEISISSEQNGFGTYVEPAFKLINDNKEKQYLKDGKKNIIIVLADGKFSDNNSYNGELKTLKDTLETNGGEIYCVGFGSGTEYDSTALANMSTNNKCYEAKDASTLLTKFNEILASVGKTQSGRTQNGKITFEEAKNTIKVSEECPIVATYGDSENETVLFTCTSDNADEMWNKYGLKIDGKIISWDAKQFAIANEGIKVPNNIKIKYYIARQ
ncbi:MAG: VWA domain-containing protein, partial [Clostridia bacterium]|nr:VWA domain-containing protein [Clostridia bacterium]